MKYDLVIFDLGGVLVDVNTERLLSGFAAKLNISINEVLTIRQNYQELFVDFDKGLFSAFEFYKRLIPESTLISYEEFCHLYTDIFKLKKDSLRIAEQIELPITILSNTDELHFNALQNFEIFHHFSKITTSFETHLLKPDKEIYLHVLDKFKVRPDRCVFIDDCMENIDGAAHLGIYAIHFKNAKELKKELMQLEIINTKAFKRRVEYAEFGN